ITGQHGAFLRLLDRAEGWKVDFESSAMPRLATNMNRALILLDDTVNGAQAETRSPPRLFGGEERLEGMLENALAHTAPRVTHLDADVLSFAQAGFVPDLPRIDEGRLDLEEASLRHGVARICRQVN